MAEKFDPAKHFRKVKGGQDYLECKWRIIWWREEHPDGSVHTEVVHADYTAGYYVVKAEVSWPAEGIGRVSATAHKSESVKDFAEALEKAETGAIGRALAMLGYGTAQAVELDEEDRILDGPVERRQGQAAQKPRDTTARAVAIQRAQDLLSRDPEARERLPKPLEQQTDEQVQKTITWLVGRANAAKKGETFWTGQAPRQGNGTTNGDAAEVDADVGRRTEELTAYVNDVDAHLQAMKGTRGPLTADQRGTWAALYTRGQALAGPATGEDSRPVVDLKPNEIATACSRYVQSCLAELAGSG